MAGSAAMLGGLSGCSALAGGHAWRRRAGPVVPFEYGCARALYEQHRHPRLLLGPDDLAALRDECRRGPCRVLLDALLRKVEPVAAGVPGSDEMAAMLAGRSGRTNGWTILTNLHDMALVGWLAEDERVLDAARRALLGDAIAHSPADVGAFAYDLLQPGLSEADQGHMREDVAKQMRKLLEMAGQQHLQGAGGNFVMTYLLYGLLWMLAIDGEEPGLEAERSTLLRGFEAALYQGLGEGGYPAEDIGYGTMMAGRLTLTAACVRRAGLYDAFASCPRLSRLGQAILHFVQPWGEFLSNTGDHGDDFRERENALPYLARYNRDPSLMWLMGSLTSVNLDKEYRDPEVESARAVSLAPGFQVPISAVSLITLPDSPRPVHPREARVPTAFRDADRGIVSFRSGWGDDDIYAYFDGSQRPTAALGHAHDSGGHFSLTALGEYFAVGPGRYGIEQDQHNVLLVDGRSGRSTGGKWAPSSYQGRLIAYRPDPLCDYAAADNTALSNCCWSFRHFGLVKGAAGHEMPGYAWTVDDVNGANDYREFWWTMHSEPSSAIALEGDHAVVHGKRHGHQLRVHFAIPAPESYPKPHTLELAQDMPGTSSYTYVSQEEQERNSTATVHHAVYFRPRLIAKLKGYNGQIMAVMVPQRRDAIAPSIESVPTLKGALAMRLTFASVTDTILWSFSHHLLEADGIRARGRWAVVRRSRADGRVLAYTIDQADRLEIDHRTYRIPRG